MKRKTRALLCVTMTLMLVLGGVSVAFAGTFMRAKPVDLTEVPDYHGWNSAITYNMSTSTGGQSVAIGFVKWRLGADNARIFPPTYAEARDAGASVADIPAFAKEEEAEIDAATGMVLVRTEQAMNKSAEDIIIVYGDVAGTGRFGLSQLVRMAAIYKAPEAFPYYQIAAGDWNDSGNIDLSDLVYEASLCVMASAPSLTESDYVFTQADGTTLNVLVSLRESGAEVYPIWTPQTDSSEAMAQQGTTARGVRLGDELQKVRDTYGFGWVSEFDASLSWFEEWTANEPDLRVFLSENAATRLVYESSDYVLRTEMFFDTQDKLIAIVFFSEYEN